MKNYWIFSTGTELARGYAKDTNSSEIAQLLQENGFDIAGISILPDNPVILRESIRGTLSAPYVDGVIITGGLGPTDDDHTVDVLHEITASSIKEDEKALKKIKEISELRNLDFQITRKQARILENSVVIENPSGLAPGMVIPFQGKFLIALPGVPGEMKNMLLDVIEYLKKHTEPAFYERKSFYIYDEAESEFQKSMRNLLTAHKANFSWGVSANPGYLKVFLENSKKTETGKFHAFIRDIEALYNGKIFSEPVPAVIHNLLIQRNQTLSIAESCTGGLLGKIITDMPGSSQYFLGSVVVYANTLKMKYLNVPEEILKTYGAVSKECAESMVTGLLARTGSDYGIAITGIAGPGGGTAEKPVGTVYISIKSPHTIETRRVFYPVPSRERIREYASTMALYYLYKIIITS